MCACAVSGCSDRNCPEKMNSMTMSLRHHSVMMKMKVRACVDGHPGVHIQLKAVFAHLHTGDDSEGDGDEAPCEVLEDECWPGTKLCVVCGISGRKVCGRCKQVQYCRYALPDQRAHSLQFRTKCRLRTHSKSHQREHWKAGHKELCGTSAAVNSPTTSLLRSAYMFPLDL